MLKERGYENKRTIVDGTKTNLWFPPNYKDARLDEILGYTEPFQLNQSEANRYASMLKERGYENKQTSVDGTQTKLWFPPNYKDARLDEILGYTEPFQLNRSEANRYASMLRERGYENGRFKVNGDRSHLWLPPQPASVNAVSPR